MAWKIIFTPQALKDSKKVRSAGLHEKVFKLLKIMTENPYANPPSYEKLLGNLDQRYSRRINIQHRLVYKVYEKERVIKIVRMWTHYE